jgi:hypothetical protein
LEELVQVPWAWAFASDRVTICVAESFVRLECAECDAALAASPANVLARVTAAMTLRAFFMGVETFWEQRMSYENSRGWVFLPESS